MEKWIFEREKIRDWRFRGKEEAGDKEAERERSMKEKLKMKKLLPFLFVFKDYRASIWQAYTPFCVWDLAFKKEDEKKGTK